MSRWEANRRAVAVAALLAVIVLTSANGAWGANVSQGNPSPTALAIIDSFTDLDYTSSPIWTVHTGTWGVNAAAPVYLRNTAADASISTPSTYTYGDWSFAFGHTTIPAFNNVIRFYFALAGNDDCSALSGTQGYYFFSNAGIGVLRLIRRDSGGAATNVVDTTWTPDTNWHTVDIRWTAAGSFTMDLDGTTVGTGSDTTYSASSYICLYNSSDSSTDRTAIDDISFTAFASPAVTVGDPNGGESLVAGSGATIWWNTTAGTFPLQANSAVLAYSSTGCAGSFSNIVTGRATSGSYAWTVPSTTTSTGCIRVRANDNQVPANQGSDTSNAVFSIVAASPPTVTVSSPNGGESWVAQSQRTIFWNSTAGSFPLEANSASVYYSSTGCGGAWTLLASARATSGSYVWSLPSATTNSACVRVTVEDDRTTPNVGADTSNAVFSIVAATPPTVTVTSPDGGESLLAQGLHTITWSSSAASFPLRANSASVYYASNGCAGTFGVLASAQPTSGSYNWSIPSGLTNTGCIRVTVEDDRTVANLGADTSNGVFSIVAANPPAVAVSTPNGGESWVAQGQRTIWWNSTPGSFPLQASSASIYFASNGCAGSFGLLASGRANSGSYSWTLPAATTSTGCIRVTAQDDRASPNQGADTSDGVFSIIAASPPSVSVITANGGEVWVVGTKENITWSASSGSFPLAASPVTLSYSTTGAGGSYTVIATAIANSGSYEWTIPGAISSNVFIRVRAVDDRAAPNTGTDLSDLAFSIVGASPPAVTVSAPNGGESWTAQSQRSISWSTGAGTWPLKADSASVHYSSTGCSGSFSLLASGRPTSGSYTWNLPSATTNAACVRVTVEDDRVAPNLGADTSDAVFAVVAAMLPTVAVTSPNGGEVWAVATGQQITWTTSPGSFPLAANPITLAYSTTGVNGTYTTIASAITDTGTYPWTVPNNLTSDAFIRVRAVDDRSSPNTGVDLSDLAFAIASATPPSVSVSTPNGGEAWVAQSARTISWSASPATWPLKSNSTSLYFSPDGCAGPWGTAIATGQPANGSLNWSVPAATTVTACIRVTTEDDRSPANTGADVSDSSFRIVAASPPSMAVTAPNGGENWARNTTHNITWAANAASFPLAPGPITIEYSTNGTNGSFATIAAGVANTGTHQWLVPASLTSTAFIRVSANDDRPLPNIGVDLSDSAFAITNASPPTIQLISPNGGEQLPVGSSRLIQWTAAPGTYPLALNSIAIHFSSQGLGGPWIPVASNLSNSGPFSWTVPSGTTCTAAIRVGVRDGQALPLYTNDSSDSTFCIVPANAAPQVAVTSPVTGATLRGTVRIDWTGSDINGGLVGYRMQASGDGGANWQDLFTVSHVEGASPTARNGSFDSTLLLDRRGYLYRLQATDPTNLSSSSTVANITVDNTPPTSRAVGMSPFSRSPSFLVNWSGSDATSGVASFDVRVSVNGSAAQPWLTATNKTSESYVGSDGGEYGFVFIARDRAGNVETKTVADFTVVVDSAPPVTGVRALPPISPLAQFDVPFDATDRGPVSVQLYYRTASSGGWLPSGSSNASPAKFTPTVEGKHEFYTIGTDQAGNVEPKAPIVEAETVVDSAAPTATLALAASVTNQDPVTVTIGARDADGLLAIQLFGAWSDRPGVGFGTPVLLWAVNVSGEKVFDEQVPIRLGKDGYFQLRSHAVDVVGREGDSSFAVVHLDTTPPAVVSTSVEQTVQGVLVDARVRLSFSEAMDRASVERSLVVEGGAGVPQTIAWASGDLELSFDLLMLAENASLKVRIAAGAADLAKNPLSPHEHAFTTVPTTGAVSGRVTDAAMRPVSGALVTLRLGDATSEASTDAAGFYRLEALPPGSYQVLVSAAGYRSASSTVPVTAGTTGRLDLRLEEDRGPFALMGGLSGLVAILALTLMALIGVVLLRRARRCPECRRNMKKGRCGGCGYESPRVKKAEIVSADKSRMAREKAAAARSTPEVGGRDQRSATRTTETPLAAATAGAVFHPVAVAKAGQKCLACGAVLPAGEVWCPKCGQAVGAPDDVVPCPKCGSAMFEGGCLECGLGPIPHPLVERSEEDQVAGKSGPEVCTNCGNPVAGSDRSCERCGADKTPPREARQGTTGPTSAETIRVRAAARRRARDTGRAAPRPETPAMDGMLPPPGNFCGTCGATVDPQLKYCDVCGDPLKG